MADCPGCVALGEYATSLFSSFAPVPKRRCERLPGVENAATHAKCVDGCRTQESCSVNARSYPSSDDSQPMIHKNQGPSGRHETGGLSNTRMRPTLEEPGRLCARHS